MKVLRRNILISNINRTLFISTYKASHEIHKQLLLELIRRIFVYVLYAYIIYSALYVS